MLSIYQLLLSPAGRFAGRLIELDDRSVYIWPHWWIGEVHITNNVPQALIEAQISRPLPVAVSEHMYNKAGKLHFFIMPKKSPWALFARKVRLKKEKIGPASLLGDKDSDLSFCSLWPSLRNKMSWPTSKGIHGNRNSTKTITVK